MHRKKRSFNGDERQLNLPFGNNDVVIVKETPDNKVVELFSKLKENNNRKESDARKRSINRLLNYAEKLNW